MRKFIYISGCDGTGKTTQSHLLIEQLTAQGKSTRHLWLRFPFLFSIPLLAYARLRGYSWYESTNGFRHGYWDFRSSWMLRVCLPWFFLVDAALASITKIYVPLWRGKTLICERFVLDMLVDLGIACGDTQIHRNLPGRLYLRLLPKESYIFIIDLDIKIIQNRRTDLKEDKRLQTRLDMYRHLADDLSFHTLSSKTPPDDLCNLILRTVYDRNSVQFSHYSENESQ